MTTPQDPRISAYQNLHRQHVAVEPRRLRAAEAVLGLVFDALKPRSVLDVGCGRGLWLSVAQGLGASETLGIEGPWIRDQTTFVDQTLIVQKDLELGFDLGRAFDLVATIEVAEHLSAEASGRFVESLTRHGEFVLFSAAIPFQPGTHHVNCQFLDYWAGLFRRHGYGAVDFIRPAIWNDRSIDVWIRQNVVGFASEKFLAAHGWARQAAERAGPLSIVHPDMYAALVAPRRG